MSYIRPVQCTASSGIASARIDFISIHSLPLREPNPFKDISSIIANFLGSPRPLKIAGTLESPEVLTEGFKC